MNIWKSAQTYFEKALHEVSEEQVIDLILAQDGGGITVRQLAELTGLSRNQAIIKLNAMCMKSLIEVDYNHYDENWNNYFRLTHKVMLNKLQGKSLSKKSKSKLTDFEVIRLAMENQNRVTTILLCAQKEVSLEEAQDKLEELYMKNVFEMIVNENGAIIYNLIGV